MVQSIVIAYNILKNLNINISGDYKTRISFVQISIFCEIIIFAFLGANFGLTIEKNTIFFVITESLTAVNACVVLL